jgi:hypothetical protein
MIEGCDFAALCAHLSKYSVQSLRLYHLPGLFSDRRHLFRRQIESDLAVRDRKWFAPENQLGVANREFAAIVSISPDGRIAARLDDNPGSNSMRQNAAASTTASPSPATALPTSPPSRATSFRSNPFCLCYQRFQHLGHHDLILGDSGG